MAILPINPWYRGNPAITLLRIILWLIPAIFVPLGIMLGVALNNRLPTPACVSIIVLLVTSSIAGIGYFQGLLAFQQMRSPRAKRKGELVISTICFVSLQIFIVPTAWLAAYIVFYLAYSLRLLVT